jgi:hypothetical protein
VNLHPKHSTFFKEDTQKRLDESQFGYQSFHYLLPRHKLNRPKQRMLYGEAEPSCHREKLKSETHQFWLKSKGNSLTRFTSIGRIIDSLGRP